MESQKRSKLNPWVVVLICLITAVVVFSTVFLILYLNSDFKEIKAKKTEYYVNIGESVKLDLTFTNVLEGEYEIVSSDATIADFNSTNKTVTGIAGGQAVLEVRSSAIKNFTPIALTVTVCDGSTQNTAFMIDSKEDLKNLNSSENMMSKYYRLIADIDLGNEEWVPLGYINGAETQFTGMFIGDAHTISNLKITTPYVNSGLFANIGKEGNVVGLNLTNVEILNNAEADRTYITIGALAGQNYGIIQKVYVANAILTNEIANKANAYVGGIAGFNTGIIAQASFENSDVVSSTYAGGIVGANVTSSDRIATVKQAGVNANIYGYTQVGGVIGIAKGSIVADCFTSKNSCVYGLKPTAYVGGIIGTNMYASVDGKIIDSFMINCYNAASVGDTGYRGSLIAWNYNYSALNLQFNKIYGSYFAEELTGVATDIYRTQNGAGAVETYAVAQQELADTATYVSYVNNAGDNIMWDFTNIWQMTADGFPILVKYGEISSSEVVDLTKTGAIYTPTDLINIANNMAGNYVLMADLELSVLDNWQAIGDEGNMFMGSFVAGKNSATHEFFKINNLTIDDASNNVGLFAYIGETGKVSNITIANASANLIGATNFGLIANVNNGIIENCSVESANVNLNDANANIGFITSVNNGSIINSKVINSQMVTNEKGTYTIGSIAGLNNGVVASCYSNEGTKIYASEVNKNVLVGGLVGVNEEAAHVRFSFSKGEFKGYAVGGLVAVNKNYVYESYSENTLTGNYVGGLAYIISFGNTNTSGVISNCYTISTLCGTDRNSVKSGFAYIIDYCTKGENAGKYGYVYHCFSGVDFNEVGDNYFETHSKVRDDAAYILFGIKGDRVAGFVIDSIYDKQGREAEEITTFIVLKLFDPILPEGPIGLQTEECFKAENFKAQEFSENIWLFTADSYPELKNVVSAAN